MLDVWREPPAGLSTEGKYLHAVLIAVGTSVPPWENLLVLKREAVAERELHSEVQCCDGIVEKVGLDVYGVEHIHHRLSLR